MAGNALADIESGLARAVDHLRGEYLRNGPSCAYLDGISRLSRVVCDIIGLEEALAPPVRMTAAERRAALPLEIGPDLMGATRDA